VWGAARILKISLRDRRGIIYKIDYNAVTNETGDCCKHPK
jgi:hypothetical protein